MKSPLQLSILVPLLIFLHITLGSLPPRTHSKKEDIVELDDIKIEPLRFVNQASKLRSKRQNYNQWNRQSQYATPTAANTGINELNRANNFGFNEDEARRALGPAPAVATTPSTIAPRPTTVATVATTTNTTPSPYRNYYETQATNAGYAQQPNRRYPPSNQYQQQPASWNSGYGGYDRYNGYNGYDYSHYRSSYKYNTHS